MKISADLLNSKGLYADDLRLFRALFGDGDVELTLDSVKRMAMAGMHMEDLARRLLDKDTYGAYRVRADAARQATTAAGEAAYVVLCAARDAAHAVEEDARVLAFLEASQAQQPQEA